MSTIVLLVLTVTLLLLALGWVLYAVALRVDKNLSYHALTRHLGEV